MRNSLLAGFVRETWEDLVGLEQGLEGLRTPQAAAAHESLALLTHRLKGSAGLYGFPQLSELAARMHQVLDRMRPGSQEGRARSAPHALFAETLAALPEALERITRSGSEDPVALGALAERYDALLAPARPLSREIRGEVDREIRRFRDDHADVLSYFAPETEEHVEGMAESLQRLETRGAGEETLASFFRQVHTLKGAALTVGCNPIGTLAHRMEDLLAFLRETRTDPGSRAAIEGAAEALRAGVSVLHSMLAVLNGSETVLQPRYDTALATLERVVQSLPEPPAEPPVELAAGDGESRRFVSTIRVDLERMDALLNRVGELVIARGRLERNLAALEPVVEQMAISRRHMERTIADFEAKYLNPAMSMVATGSAGTTPPTPDGRWGGVSFGELELDRYDDFNVLARHVGEVAADLGGAHAELARRLRQLRGDAEELQRLTRGLRSIASRSRMVAISQLFGRFERLVHQVSKQTGKQVVLETSGETVEVDAAIIERIADPLTHLVLNAVIHGIEPVELRRARAKPERGKVSLRAFPHGSSFHVEVEDDGGGIDLERLKNAVVRGGWRSAEQVAALSDEEAVELIYLSGLSTREEVTSTAGRGIGMDIVQNNVLRLNGEIEVETRAGAGTRFTLRLPLTLLVSEVLMVRVGAQRLALPVPAVARLLYVDPLALASDGETERLELGEETIDFLRLDRILGLSPTSTGAQLPVVVIRSGGRRIAVSVDELLGTEEVVIKNLGGMLAQLSLFAAATISAEGQIVLLLDTTTLVAGAHLRTLSQTSSVPVVLREQRTTAGALLLADDSPSVRTTLSQMLTRAGYEVETAVDGRAVLEALRMRRFDALITDLEMPHLSGYEVIEDLRRQPATSRLPILVITSRASPKHADLADRLGATRYFTKPVDEQALLASLRALVQPAPTQDVLPEAN